MDKETLIKKWLNNDLNSIEFEAFKKLEDYESLVKLSNNLKHFKASDYDSSEELDLVLQKINKNKSSSNTWIKPLLRIAAILVVCFGIYYYTSGLDTTINTLTAQKTNVELPDASEVQLNADSKIIYNKRGWTKIRDVELSGEAYFKVEKGSTFNVITDSGTITVLGTQFNVNHRENYFEVVCFEGSVSVKQSNREDILNPGDRFTLVDGKYSLSNSNATTHPYWIDNQSHFKSIPYKYVLKEFERQFNVTLNINDSSSLNKLFTGTFKHDNLELALKSVTLPLNLKYQFLNDTTIVLSRE